MADFIATARDPSGAISNPFLFTVTRNATMIKDAGDNQIGLPGSQLPVRISVRVIDGAGNGIGGQAINFSVASGTVSAAQVITGPFGYAQVWWTLGPALGVQMLIVSSVSGQTLSFNATAVSGGGGGTNFPAFADFESGNLGDFLTGDRLSNVGNANVNLVNFGGRNCVRLRYVRDTPGMPPGGDSLDANTAIQTNATPARGMGQTFGMESEFFMPTPDASQQYMLQAPRKLFYPQIVPNAAVFVVLSSSHLYDPALHSNRLVLTYPDETITGGWQLFCGWLPYDVWTKVRMEVTLNSAVLAKDGIVRVWVNDVMMLEITNAGMYYRTEGPFSRYLIGTQTMPPLIPGVDPFSILYNEDRYLDNARVY